VRRLADGREFRIVKVFRSAAELRDRLAALGLVVEVEPLGESILLGTALRRRVDLEQ
jgi:hypothetical protein